MIEIEAKSLSHRSFYGVSPCGSGFPAAIGISHGRVIFEQQSVKKDNDMSTDRVSIPKLEGDNCFACGTDNPIGLNLDFYREGDSVCCDVVLSRNHEGWQNMAHGGIISTLLDEVMSWTVIYFKKSFAVTRSMEVRYLRPVPLKVPLIVRGRIISEDGRDLCRVEAVLLSENEKKLARARGEFLILSEEKLTLLTADFKKDMLELIRNFP
jgi:acyl-coenzyme A thioesterase PaaI-like protein